MADYYSANNLTGVTPALLDIHGHLYVSQIDDTGGYYHTEIFNDVGRTSLVGHTATYNSGGAKTVVADNGSGLGGTITVATLGAWANTILGFYFWGVVDTVAADSMTIQGPVLGDNGNVVYAWYGPPEKVVTVLYNLPGEYATVGSTSALWDYGNIYGLWTNERAHCAGYALRAKSVAGSSPPRINLILTKGFASAKNSNEGWEVASGSLVWATDPNANVYQDYKSPIEVAVTAPGASSDDQDLSIYLLMVLE